MTINRINWISFVLVGVMFGVAAWVYPMLPDPMPSHWNAAGEVDDWMSKPWGALVMPLVALGSWGALVMPLVALGSWVMFLVLPLISPKGFRLDAARRAYDIICTALLV